MNKSRAIPYSPTSYKEYYKHWFLPLATKQGYRGYPLATTGILTLCPLLPFIKTSPKL